jgi:hypothetical protein
MMNKLAQNLHKLSVVNDCVGPCLHFSSLKTFAYKIELKILLSP